MKLEDERITLETAKLAKAKGFHVGLFASYTEYLKTKIDKEYPEGGGFGYKKGEVEFNTFWFCNDHPNMDYSNKNYIMYAAPTQALLQRWLREKHGIHVEIYCNASGWGYILTKLNGTTIKEIDDDIFFVTAELACEKGLQFALNSIVI